MKEGQYELSCYEKIDVSFTDGLIDIFLNSCGTTGGGVGYEWGEGSGNGHHHEIKKGGPPPHAPAYGYRAKYQYRYYPSAGVYYDTYRQLYFYLSQ